jgi:hypothetical protein
LRNWKRADLPERRGPIAETASARVQLRQNERKIHIANDHPG